MKITQILRQQHIGRAIRTRWQMEREKIIPVAPVQKMLQSMGNEVVDANELMKEITRNRLVGRQEVPFIEPLVEEDPEPVKDVPVYMYDPKYTVQAGLHQAQILTNSMVEEDMLLKKYKLEDVSEELSVYVQRTIANAAIFDAHQEKLPKLKDPRRPMFVFPRVYGITQRRKTHGIVSRLLQVCENVCGSEVSRNRFVQFNADVGVRVERFGHLLQCNIAVDTLLRSRTALDPIVKPGPRPDFAMPSIYPLEPFISIPFTQAERDVKTNTWRDTPWKNVHTLFVYHDPESVQNLTELPVTDHQMLGRTLLNVFTVAANSAMNTHGQSIDRLSKPVTVQCVQTDGQDFVFSVFQLNGLSGDVINRWWLGPKLRLYEKAQYENGRPVFTEYNPEVFKSLLAFYRQ